MFSSFFIISIYYYSPNVNIFKSNIFKSLNKRVAAILASRNVRK